MSFNIRSKNMTNKNIIPKPRASSNNFHCSVVNCCRNMPCFTCFNQFPMPEKTFAPRKIIPQAFSYPNPMINYIKKNPTTPKIYISLLKSCKYFYSKKDLIIPLNTYDRRELWEIIKSKKDATNYKLPFNIWLTDVLDLTYPNPDVDWFYFDFYFYKYAKKFTLKVIRIYDQSISFEELKLLTNNGLQNVSLQYTTIFYSNGDVVPVERIFAVLKNIKSVFYLFSGANAKLVTAETTQNLIEAIDTSELESFCLQRIPPNFDFETLKKFTDAHQNIYFKFYP